MAISNGQLDREPIGLADSHLAQVASNGCGNHPHVRSLLESTGAVNSRDLADCIHLLCSVHGRHPGLIEIASQSSGTASVKQWLGDAAEAFEAERAYLLRLTASVGPMPSTPGAAETEASLMGQRNALEILARSERHGCAIGAACALIGDWAAIRRLLDRAAARVGLEPPALRLPGPAAISGLVATLGGNPSSERALTFGTEQLLTQHRALFDLLEARSEARVDY